MKMQFNRSSGVGIFSNGSWLYGESWWALPAILSWKLCWFFG